MNICQFLQLLLKVRINRFFFFIKIGITIKWFRMINLYRFVLVIFQIHFED